MLQGASSSSKGLAPRIYLSDSSDDESERREKALDYYKVAVGSASGADGRCNLEILDKAVAYLLSIFPKLCPQVAAAKLSSQLKRTSVELALQRITEQFLEHGLPAPKVEQQEGATSGEKDVRLQSSLEGFSKPDDAEEQVEPFKLDTVPSEVVSEYKDWCNHQLTVEFPRASMSVIKKSLKMHKGRFGPAYRTIKHAYELALAKEKNCPADTELPIGLETKPVEGLGGGLKLLKNVRVPLKASALRPCPFFEKEWTALQLAFSKVQEQQDEAVAKELNEKEYVSSGQQIECGCCYSDYPFEEMAQCAEGHLFCFGCLRRQVEESTFGGLQARGALPCMDTDGCTESFPLSEVRRALPPEVLLKYEQRQAEDAVARAKIPGLVYCPFCNMPWQVDPELRVLECPNETCRKASCILCKEPSHLPLRCEEAEKKSETCLRRRIEELMTKALIRECNSCRAELVKSDGCNKVTCRCGQTMCYVCRKSIQANYSHFCQHTWEPGKPCLRCELCHLWEQEEEQEVVNAAKEAAMKEIADKEPSLLKRPIGPKPEPPPKKRQQLPPAHQPPFLPGHPIPFPLENLAQYAQAMADAAMNGNMSD